MANERPVPPRWPDRFIEFFCAPHMLEEVMGDLHERYQLRVTKLGEAKARKQYWREVLAYARPHIFKRTKPHYPKPIFTDMLRTYFKIAFRNILSKKVYSGINIFGLAIGITCCLLIFQFVVFEYSFDTFNKNFSSIYRVVEVTYRAGEKPEPQATTGWAVGPAVAQEVPEVKSYARLHPDEEAIVSNPQHADKVFEERMVCYVDSSYFKMFSVPLAAGDSTQVLGQSGTVMLSENAARKYFGDEDPLGKTLDVSGWIKGSFRVDAVFKDPPSNSHLQFDILLPMTDLLKRSRFSDASTGWGWTNFITYVQLHEGADRTRVEHKFTEILKRNNEKEWKESNLTEQLQVQPLRDIHLNDEIIAPKVTNGSFRAVYFFTIIGLVTLLIALVNYINLTTARALDRAREVGVRKVIGGKRRQLILQFLSESALSILIAFVFAVVLLEIFRPFVNDLTGTHLTNSLWVSPAFWIGFVIVFFSITLSAGLYPAFMLSNFKPMSVLKGKGSISSGGAWLRQGLVVFQFTASIVLLVGTAVVYLQLTYMQTLDPGIDLKQVLTVSGPQILPEGTTRWNAIETFTHELSSLAGVSQTATSDALPGNEFSFTTPSITRVGQEKSIPGSVTWIDTTFASLYGLELVAGNGFRNVAGHSDKDDRLVIANETAIRGLGFKTPEQALNERIDIANGNICRVVGVFKDFSWSSAHQKRENAFYFHGVGRRHISIKADTKNISATISSIEKIYKQLFPGNPFIYAFADETFANQYHRDEKFATLFSVFAGLAIFIACLGLFGLVTFTAKARTKEMGIRKVLGASVANLVGMLSKDFLKLIVIGFLLAIPIAWFIMNRWLETFAYRIAIGPGVFVMAGLAAIMIAAATVSWQLIKTAITNPVESLKDE